MTRTKTLDDSRVFVYTGERFGMLAFQQKGIEAERPAVGAVSRLPETSDSHEEKKRFHEKKELENTLQTILQTLRSGEERYSFSEKIELTNTLVQFDEDRKLTSEVCERARWIVEWAIGRVRAAEKGTSDESHREDADLIRELLFSFSPNVFNYVSLGDQIPLLAKSSRIAELQGTLVQPFVGEVVYELSFARAPEEILEGASAQLSLSDKLDFIDFLPTLFAHARAQGEWADPCTRAVERTLQTLQTQDDSFFIQALTSLAEQAIQAEQEEPTASVIQYKGDQRVGRRAVDQAALRTEDITLKQKIPLAQPASTSLRRMSKDAVAAFDHAAIPQGYLLLTKPEEEALPVSTIDGEQVSTVEQQLRRSDQLIRPQVRWWCLMALQTNLLPVEQRTASAWEARLPVFSAVEWERYWQLEQDTQRLVDEIRALRAAPQESEEQVAKLTWKMNLLQEELQPFSDRLYRDPRLVGVLRNLTKELPHPEPVSFAPFEHFEGDRRFMPKGEKADIDAATLLQVMHRPLVREALEKQLNLSLESLSLREQIQLLAFLAQSTREKQQKAFQFMSQFGIAAARSFLSCEYDPKMGDVILSLAEGREVLDVKQVLERYSALVERSAESVDELRQQFYQANAGSEKIPKEAFEDSLLSRAKQLLADASKKKDQPLDKVLVGYEENLAVFTSLFKAVFKDQRTAVSFEAIRGLAVDKVRLTDLSEEEKQNLYLELKPLITENWTRSDTEAGAGVLKRFETLFSNPNQPSTFFVLRHEGRVTAFVRFDDRPDLGENAVYAGSLNVSKTVQSSGIGGAFVREMVEQKIGEKELFADVLATDAVGNFYVEELGCVIEGVKRSADGGDAYFALRRSKALNAQLTTKTEMLHLLDEKRVSAAFDLPQDKDRFIQWVEEVTKSGKLVTRYQISRGTNGQERRFLLAEPVPENRTKEVMPLAQVE